MSTIIAFVEHYTKSIKECLLSLLLLNTTQKVSATPKEQKMRKTALKKEVTKLSLLAEIFLRVNFKLITNSMARNKKMHKNKRPSRLPQLPI